jgi:hypothetical protein
MKIETDKIDGSQPLGLSASEAVYGVLGWLTSLSDPVTLGAHYDASVAADAAKAFCDANELDEPRESWHCNLIHPSCECSQSNLK